MKYFINATNKSIIAALPLVASNEIIIKSSQRCQTNVAKVWQEYFLNVAKETLKFRLTFVALFPYFVLRVIITGDIKNE